MCFDLSKLARVLTATSPNRIIPKKAQLDIAHMHASNGWSVRRVALMAASIWSVIGGLIGLRRVPCRFSIPRSDQLIRVKCSGDSGGGHPCAKCHARIAERYFLATETETGSKGMTSADADFRKRSVVEGSETAQSANECSSSKDAGRRSASGMENMSQKM
jgi:hypothetical protein